MGVRGARIISNIKSLKILDVWCNELGDEGAKEISKLSNLTTLLIGDNNIRNEGFHHLASKLGNLEYLSIGYNYITNCGNSLSNLKKLTFLDIHNNLLLDESFLIEACHELKLLERLNVNDCNLNSQAFAHISKLKHLTVLQAKNCYLD